MGQKDITQRRLEQRNDVFADIVNALAFGGEQVIRPDELEDAQARSQYKMAGTLREQERDVAKLWRGRGVRLAFLGLENQTEPDRDMPLRVLGYDAAGYRGQLAARDGERRERREALRRGGEPPPLTPLCPVVTFVLYLGYKEHWNAPRDVRGCLGDMGRLEPFVHNYGMNLFEIAWLGDEARGRFRSGFAVVADYLHQMRVSGDYRPGREEYGHIEEILDLLSAMTGDRRFLDYYEPDMAGRKVTMCEVIDRYLERGRQDGIAIGRRDGIAIGRQDGIAIGRRDGIAIGREQMARQMLDYARQAGVPAEQLRRMAELAQQG